MISIYQRGQETCLDVAGTRAKITAALEEQKREIQRLVQKCFKHYDRGISKIDRSHDKWILVPYESVESLHSRFVKAYNYLIRASNLLSECKDQLNNCSRDMAEQSTVLSEDIRATNQKLKEIKAGLESKEKDVKNKKDEIEKLQKELRSKRNELDETETKRNVALTTASACTAASAVLVIFGPATIPTAVAASTAAGTAATLLGVTIALQNDIEKLEKKIRSCSFDRDAASDELDRFKKEKKDLTSEKQSKTKKIASLKEESENVRRLIHEISDFLLSVKGCVTVMGEVVNKFECLKDESNPEYCYNLSVLKGPVRELEDSMRPNMLTF